MNAQLGPAIHTQFHAKLRNIHENGEYVVLPDVKPDERRAQAEAHLQTLAPNDLCVIRSGELEYVLCGKDYRESLFKDSDPFAFFNRSVKAMENLNKSQKTLRGLG